MDTYVQLKSLTISTMAAAWLESDGTVLEKYSNRCMMLSSGLVEKKLTCNQKMTVISLVHASIVDKKRHLPLLIMHSGVNAVFSESQRNNAESQRYEIISSLTQLYF